MTKVWITKYALTSGIFTRDVEIKEEMACWKENNYSQYAHGEGRDWHKTEHAAFDRAEKMRSAKIASLKKSIAKLERLKFGN